MIMLIPGVDSPVEVDTSAADGLPWGRLAGGAIVLGAVLWLGRALAEAFRAVAATVLLAVLALAVLGALAGFEVSR